MNVDPLVCSNCGGPMKIVAFITDRKVMRLGCAPAQTGRDQVARIGGRYNADLGHPEPFREGRK